MLRCIMAFSMEKKQVHEILARSINSLTALEGEGGK